MLPDTLFIDESVSAKSAMKQIDRNNHGVVFVVGKSHLLRGVLTAGDIRRSLNNGQDITNPVSVFMNEEPMFIHEGTDIKIIAAQVIEELRTMEKKIGEAIYSLKIPIVNKKNQVINIANFYQDDANISLSFGLQDAVKSKAITRVLLVGGAGYLGSVLTRVLLDHGYHVRVLDSLSFGDGPVQELLTNPHFELLEGDVRDIQTLHTALIGTDAVIHLAAIVGDPAGQKNPQETIAINYLASMTLALACKYHQINKFIFASTCSVYGVGEELLTEEAALNPVSLYARTKIESEKGILSLADENFRPIIMRMSTLYGMSPRMRFDLVVNTFSKMATLDGKITVFGGDQWRPLLHVKDAAMAYLKVLEHPLTNLDNLIFNVGSDEQNYTIRSLARYIKEVLPQTKVQTKKEKSTTTIDKRTYRVSFNKIKENLGFETKHKVKESILEIHEAIKNGSIPNAQDSHYYNFIQ